MFILSLVVAVWVPGCNGDDGGPSTPQAAALAFIVQPATTTAGQTITPAIQVEIRDANGSVIPTATNTVTLSLAANPGGATLMGTTSVSAVNGVATFSNVSIQQAASGYTLTATSSTLSVTSTPFEITAAAAAQLAFRTDPADSPAREAISPGVEVEIQDQFGNHVTTATNEVTLAIETNPGTMALYATGGQQCSDPCSLQRVDHVTPAALPPLSNSHGDEITAMTYDPEMGGVLATDLQLVIDPDFHELSTVNPVTGEQSLIGETGGALFRGLVFDPDVERRLLGFSNTACCGSTSPGDELHQINLTTGASTLVGNVTVSGETVTGSNGMAVDPTDGTVYAVIRVQSDASNQIRRLMTLDVSSLVATNIAILSENGVASIAFTVDGTLLAVTGRGAPIPQTLFTVDKSDGTMTQIIQLGDGSNIGSAMTTVPARLSGTLTVAANGGVATFSNLQIDAPASGYTLQATAAGLTAGISAAFAITAP